MEESAILTLKIIILGSSEVGKTSILERYFKNEFHGNQLSSIGIDFQTKFFKFDENKIKVNYIDTAGQEKFRAISVNYLKAAHGVILVFDITKEKTFSALEEWMNHLKENNQLNIEKVLIGNKIDLEEKRKIQTIEGENFKNENKIEMFMESSAKTGFNAQNIFIEAAKVLYNEHLKYKDRATRQGSLAEIMPISPKIQNINDSEVSRKKCCF